MINAEARYSLAVPWLLRISLAVLIFTIPFESIETTRTTESSFTISKMAGWVFFLVAALYPKNSFRKFPSLIWLFLFYLVVFFIYGLYQDAVYMPAIFERTMTFIQMIIFLWIVQNLLVDTETAHIVLFTLGFSTALMAIFQAIGITNAPLSRVEGRMSALGEDPNSLAALLSLGFLSLMGLAYFSIYRSKVLKIAVLPMLAIISVTIVQTGSRSGTLGLLMGILVFMLNKQGKHPYIKNLAIVTAAVAAIAVVTLSDPGMRHRFEQSYYHGNMAKRELIVPTALEMFFEKPIFGWGPYKNTKELGTRLNYPSLDTHNLFLMLMTEVGVIGTVPYLIGLALCGYKAFQARSRLSNVLPLALFLCLMMINNGITWHTRKLHWFVLAYCIASFSYSRAYGKLLNTSYANKYAVA